jgi:hypothetical protein
MSPAALSTLARGYDDIGGASIDSDCIRARVRERLELLARKAIRLNFWGGEPISISAYQ